MSPQKYFVCNMIDRNSAMLKLNDNDVGGL